MIISPKWGKNSVDIGRDIVKNNRAIQSVDFVIHSNDKWLPQILTDAGFFPSNSEMKRNRPDLWIEISGTIEINLKWANILVTKHDSTPRMDPES